MGTEITPKGKLRFDFVGMAFALAVGQVGIEIGDFYSSHLSIVDYPFVFSQLLLGTYIIASSWVGWQKSESQGNLEEVENTFGKSFILLLIDLFLVLCYFILVKGVEKPYENHNISLKITSKPETFWSLVIFSVYLIWDILTKLIHFDSNKFKLSLHWKAYFKRGYQAIVCILLVYMIILIHNNNNPNENVMQVVLTDICLLFIFILFRGMKEKIETEKHKLTIVLKYFLYISLPIIIVILYFINWKFTLITM